MGVEVRVRLDDVPAIAQRKALRFANAVIGAAASEAMRYTPREYGTLAASQYTNVWQGPGGVYGVVGYGTNYAERLNGDGNGPLPSWRPRPINMKDGPSTNMRAVPGFLNKGFESSRARSSFSSFEALLRI